MEPVVGDIGLENVAVGYTETTEAPAFDGAAEAAFNAAVPGAVGAGARPRGGRAPRGQPGCRVYVGNLSWDAAWQDLKDHMRGPAGDLDVTHADIMTEASGRSKGCAIVEYSNANDAQRAIAELNDTDLLSRLIFVREDREGDAPRIHQQHQVPRGGYGGGGFRGGYQGGGYPGYAGGYDQYGMFPQQRGGFRGGYGGQMQGGYGQYGGFQGGGGRVFQGGRGRGMGVQGGYRGRGGGGRGGMMNGGGGAPAVAGDGRRVYVGNLSWECQWQDLKDHMRSVGEVTYADVLSGPDGRSKGCGLVEYSSPDQAQRAIAELNDTELMGRMVFVREDREQRA